MWIVDYGHIWAYVFLSLLSKFLSNYKAKKLWELWRLLSNDWLEIKVFYLAQFGEKIGRRYHRYPGTIQEARHPPMDSFSIGKLFNFCSTSMLLYCHKPNFNSSHDPNTNTSRNPMDRVSMYYRYKGIGLLGYYQNLKNRPRG